MPRKSKSRALGPQGNTQHVSQPGRKSEGPAKRLNPKRTKVSNATKRYR